MRIIALDYGKARIGIAITDISKTIAYPLKVIKTKDSLEKTAESILESLSSYLKDTELIIIGLPLHMDGSLSLMAIDIKKFAAILSKKTNIPIKFIDERFSTKIAETDLKENLKLNRKKRSKIIDSTSACVLLRTLLI